jgi:hypothetical protein
MTIHVRPFHFKGISGWIDELAVVATQIASNRCRIKPNSPVSPEATIQQHVTRHYRPFRVKRIAVAIDKLATATLKVPADSCCEE